MEKLCEKFYKSIGVNFKIVKEKFPNDILVFKDYFISLFISEELRNKMRALLESRDIMKLLKEVMECKSSIQVVVTIDEDLASEIKKQTVGKFK